MTLLLFGESAEDLATGVVSGGRGGFLIDSGDPLLKLDGGPDGFFVGHLCDSSVGR